MENELLYVDLPKWSRMVVSGDNITKEQAAEIIIRTCDIHFSTNDHSWRHQLNSILGIEPNDNKGWYFVPEEKRKELELSLGLLDLEYLQNEQIVSSWVGGPHGWCFWDGTIGCDGYNIGKWPSVKTVLKEWKLIAHTWPFLKLKCQLWDEEDDDEPDDNEPDDDDEEDDDEEDDDEPDDDVLDEDNYIQKGSHKPIVEFQIQDGTVSLVKPKNILKSSSHYGNIFNFLRHGGERGCSLSQFRYGIECAQKAVKANKPYAN